MSEQLKQALELHKRGDLEKALPLYEHVKYSRPTICRLSQCILDLAEPGEIRSIHRLPETRRVSINESGLWNNLETVISIRVI